MARMDLDFIDEMKRMIQRGEIAATKKTLTSDEQAVLFEAIAISMKYYTELRHKKNFMALSSAVRKLYKLGLVPFD